MNLDQKQQQQQKMSPSLMYTLRIITMDYTHVQEEIEKHLSDNPLLERRDQSNKDIDYDISYDDHDAIGMAKAPISLVDHLLSQWQLENIPKLAHQLGEKIIANLDDKGFHKEAPHLLCTKSELAYLDLALTHIQQLNPPGCAVADSYESIYVQALQQGQHLANSVQELQQGLQAWQQGKITQALTLLHLKLPQQLDAMIRFIQTLQPYPGLGYQPHSSAYIHPELAVYWEHDTLQLHWLDDSIPQLSINTTYTDQLHHSLTDAQTKAYLQQKLQEATQFLHALQKRQQTIWRIVSYIVHYQHNFFTQGSIALKPLTQQQVASVVQLSASTISRIVQQHAIQSPHGVIRLKQLLSPKAVQHLHKAISQASIKEHIKNIIKAHENSLLSDQQITDILHESGVPIARRTVNKYRRSLFL
jgi:RNA polymerase sigma-54 factor